MLDPGAKTENGRAGRWIRLGLVVSSAVALLSILVLTHRIDGTREAVAPCSTPPESELQIGTAAHVEGRVPDLPVPPRTSIDGGPQSSTVVEEPAAQSVWRLRGVVEDEAGVPVPGAEVMLDSARSDPRFTDESGEFVFESSEFNVFAHLRALLTTHIDYAPLRTEVRVPSGFSSSREFDVRLRLTKGVTVTIQVIDEVGAPVSDARVRLRRVVDPDVRSSTAWLTAAEWERALRKSMLSSPGAAGGTTDVAGVLSLQVEPGRFAVTGWKPGFTCRRDDATLREVSGDSPSITYRLERGSSLNGIVQDPEGSPVSGATVHSRVRSASSGFSWAMATSLDDGSFEITGLPLDATSTFVLAGHADFATSFQRKVDPSAVLVVTLSKGRELVCKLVDASTGLGIADGLEVKLEFDPLELAVAELHRAMLSERVVVQQGAIRIEHIPEFVGAVLLQVPGYEPCSVDLSIATEGGGSTKVELNPWIEHSILVIDRATGERVDDAEVTLWTGERGEDGSMPRTSLRPLPLRVTPDGVEFLLADHLMPHAGDCSIQVYSPRHRTLGVPFQRTDRDPLEPWVVVLDRME